MPYSGFALQGKMWPPNLYLHFGCLRFTAKVIAIVKLQSCKNFKKSSNFLAKRAKGRGFKIGPKWMSFPSKARILVLFKRFLLKKAIDRKLQWQKVSNLLNFDVNYQNGSKVG